MTIEQTNASSKVWKLSHSKRLREVREETFWLKGRKIFSWRAVKTLGLRQWPNIYKLNSSFKITKIFIHSESQSFFCSASVVPLNDGLCLTLHHRRTKRGKVHKDSNPYEQKEASHPIGDFSPNKLWVREAKSQLWNLRYDIGVEVKVEVKGRLQQEAFTLNSSPLNNGQHIVSTGKTKQHPFFLCMWPCEHHVFAHQERYVPNLNFCARKHPWSKIMKGIRRWKVYPSRDLTPVLLPQAPPHHPGSAQMLPCTAMGFFVPLPLGTGQE